MSSVTFNNPVKSHRTDNKPAAMRVKLTASVKTRPKYFPHKNCPRDIGFERTVYMVLLSNSLYSSPIPIKTAMSIPKTEIIVSPKSCSTFSSWFKDH